jgi:hypothetical protein
MKIFIKNFDSVIKIIKRYNLTNHPDLHNFLKYFLKYFLYIYHFTFLVNIDFILNCLILLTEFVTFIMLYNY